MCGALMRFKHLPNEHITSKELFLIYFIDPFLSLKSDRVVNVRMSLSETLSVHHQTYPEQSLIM